MKRNFAVMAAIMLVPTVFLLYAIFPPHYEPGTVIDPECLSDWCGYVWKEGDNESLPGALVFTAAFYYTLLGISLFSLTRTREESV